MALFAQFILFLVHILPKPIPTVSLSHSLKQVGVFSNSLISGHVHDRTLVEHGSRGLRIHIYVPRLLPPLPHIRLLKFCFVVKLICVLNGYTKWLIIAGVAIQTFFINKYRIKKFGLVDQFIMSYGGLRG